MFPRERRSPLHKCVSRECPREDCELPQVWAIWSEADPHHVTWVLHLSEPHLGSDDVRGELAHPMEGGWVCC